jgi:sugar (pentulose or hexulose) kinase
VAAGADELGAAEPVRLGGGGRRSGTWRRIIATALDRPLLFSDRDSSFGAAVIAAEGAGWRDVFEAADEHPAIVTEPDAAGVPALAACRARFRGLSADLAAVPRA